MTQPAALPSFLHASTPSAPAARPRLLDLPAAPPAPAMAQDVYRPTYPQPQPMLVPVYAANGQIMGYVAAPPSPPQPQAPVPNPISADQRTGQAALTTVTAGLGVAGVFAPPVLPFAGAIGLVQALDTQIGNPVSKSVGFVVNGVVDGANAVGKFFGNLFGGKKD